MTSRNWKDPSIPETTRVSETGALITTSASILGPQGTAVASIPGATVQTVNGPTIDLGDPATTPRRRIGVLAQWIPNVTTDVPPNLVEFEIQWSFNGTDFWVAPTSAQGDNRTSTVVTGTTDKSIISRGQVLARYFRWQMRKPSTTNPLPAGMVQMWWTRI